MMIRKIFNALSLRERYLLATIIWVLLLVWILEILDDFQSTWAIHQLNSTALRNFEQTLEQADEAEALLRSARQGLDGAKTFSASQLVGQLDSIARENEISSFDISTPSTQETQLFSFHNVRLTIKRGRISELIRFDQAVKEHSPYIALSDFQLSANKRDPRYLDAVFELVSFELKEEALND